MKALMDIIVSPIETINLAMLSYVQSIKSELLYNGQVLALETILNYNFPDPQPIFITDADIELQNAYIWNTSEAEPDEIWMYQTEEIKPDEYIYQNQEHIMIDDFFVWVPLNLYNSIDASGELPKFDSIIKKRKIAGKKYSIKTY
jgi:hypothetical protein